MAGPCLRAAAEIVQVRRGTAPPSAPARMCASGSHNRHVILAANSRRIAMLPTPGFHHLHLNSVDPDAAIDWYTRQFACTAKTEWGGHKALKSDNNVLILFNKVDKPAPQLPPSAIWHFGWHVVHSRATVEEWKSRPE